MKLLFSLLSVWLGAEAAFASTPTPFPPPFVHQEFTTNLTAISALTNVLKEGGNVMFTVTPSNIIMSAAAGSASNAVTTVKTNGASAGVGVTTMNFNNMTAANNGSGTVTLNLPSNMATNNADNAFVSAQTFGGRVRVTTRPGFQSMIDPIYVGGSTNGFWQWGADPSIPDFTLDMKSNGVLIARLMVTPEGPIVAGGFSDSSSFPGTNMFSKPTIATNAGSRFAGSGSGLTSVTASNVTLSVTNQWRVDSTNAAKASTNALSSTAFTGQASSTTSAYTNWVLSITNGLGAGGTPNAVTNNYTPPLTLSNNLTVAGTITATGTNAGYLAVGNTNGTPVITLDGTNGNVSATRFVGSGSNLTDIATSQTNVTYLAVTNAPWLQTNGNGSALSSVTAAALTSALTNWVTSQVTGGSATNAIAMSVGRGTNTTLVNPTNVGTFTVQAPAGVTVVSNYIDGVTALSTNLIGYGSISASNGFYGDGSHLTGVQAGASTNSISVATFSGSGIVNSTNGLVITQSLASPLPELDASALTNILGSNIDPLGLPTVPTAEGLDAAGTGRVFYFDGNGGDHWASDIPIVSPGTNLIGGVLASAGRIGATNLNVSTSTGITTTTNGNTLTFSNSAPSQWFSGPVIGGISNVGPVSIGYPNGTARDTNSVLAVGTIVGIVDVGSSNTEGFIQFAFGGDATMRIDSGDGNFMNFRSDGAIDFNATGDTYTFDGPGAIYGNGGGLTNVQWSSLTGVLLNWATNTFTGITAALGYTPQPTNANLTAWAAQSPTTYTNGLQGAGNYLTSLNGAQPTNTLLTAFATFVTVGGTFSNQISGYLPITNGGIVYKFYFSTNAP